MEHKSLRFLFFLERDFHIALLKPIMQYIYRHRIGEISVYSPFSSSIKSVLENSFPFNINIINDPWSWSPDITFMADFSYQYVEGLGKLVNIGHGTICKGWFYSYNKISQRENSADLICVPGSIHKKRLESNVFKPIAVTGMPKLDNCFNGTLNKGDLYRKFGLNPEYKTVLLAPTFNEEFSILTYLKMYDLTNIFPENINLIVKLHGVSDREILERFKELAPASTPPHISYGVHKENSPTLFSWGESGVSTFAPDTQQRYIYMADGYDTDELFFISDLMISDVSSVIYEFISLRKPVLLFDSPKQTSYINLDTTDLEWEFRDVGYRFNNLDILKNLIIKTLSEPYIARNEEIIDSFITFKDGKAAERVVKHALNLLETALLPDLSVLYLKDNLKIENRFAKQFPLIKSNEDCFFKAITESLRTISTEYILFLHPAFDYSPQIANILLNHIKNNKNVGLVVPLIFDEEIHLQQTRFRVKINDNDDFTKVALQLNYSLAGHNNEIDYILPYCFLIKKSLLYMNFTDITNSRLCIYELLANTVKNKQKVILAYDSIIKMEKGKEHLITKNDNITEDINEDIEEDIDIFDEDQETKFRNLVAENPSNEDNLLKLIRYYYNHQKWEQLDVYADMIFDNVDIKYYSIRSLEEQGFIKAAFEKINEINIERVINTELKENLLTLKSSLSKKYDLDIIEALQIKGLELQKEQKYIEASDYFNQILNIDPENFKALNELLKNSWITRDFEMIETAFDNYLNLHPNNVDMLFILAGICFETNNLEKSMTLINKVKSFNPEYLGANELIENIKIKEKSYNQ